MIRQTILLLVTLVAACQFGGCVSVQTASGSRTVYWVPLGWDSGERLNRAGTSYYDERWGSDSSSHPAVRRVPRDAPQSAVAAEEKFAESSAGSASSGSVTSPYPDIERLSTPTESAVNSPVQANASASANPVAPTAALASSAYPPYAGHTSREAAADGHMSGAVVGALLGAQAGNRAAGIVIGSATGALIGGKLADPCQPDANYGSLWGGLAGAWLGSLFGGGRGRDFFIALGAAGGAVRGTERVADGRRCR